MHLDNNGTTFLLPEVREKVQEVLADDIGNPASISAEGRMAYDLVETAREHLSELLHTEPRKLLFTSSGSEANVAVVRTALRRTGKSRVVLSEIEHSSLSELAALLEEEGVDVRWVRVRPDGIIDEHDLFSAVTSDTALVSLQMVNNETGVIQPYQQAARIAHTAGALFHTDAAQAIGKLRVVAGETGADYLTLTGHKFHAPPGVGAIWSADGYEDFAPLITGGSQEHERRGGTHNVLGITGLGEASRVRNTRLEAVVSHMAELRNAFEQAVLSAISTARVNGAPDRRVCNTSNILFQGIDGKALYLRLIAADVACSQTSACTTQYPEPSKVLRAMGLSYDQAFASIRFSFSELNTQEEVAQAVELVVGNYYEIRQLVGMGW